MRRGQKPGSSDGWFFGVFFLQIFVLRGVCAKPRLARRHTATPLSGTRCAEVKKPAFYRRRVVFFSSSGARCAKPRLARRHTATPLSGTRCAEIKTPVRSAGGFLPFSGARCAEPRLATGHHALRAATVAPRSNPGSFGGCVFRVFGTAARPAWPSPGRDGCADTKTPVRSAGELFFSSFSGARCAEPRLARRGRLRGEMVAPRSKPRFDRRVNFWPFSGARCAEPRLARRGRLRGRMVAPRSEPRFDRRVNFFSVFGGEVGRTAARPAGEGQHALRGAMVAPRSKPRFVRRVNFSFSGRTAARPAREGSPGPRWLRLDQNPGSFGG
jgi:hypothetical protein